MIRQTGSSRVPLRLGGKQEYQVPPLPLSEQDADPTGAASTAVRLFLERAQSIRPDTQLTVSYIAAVAAICARVDGLPLAIELAAARTRVVPVDAMVAYLDRRLPFLAGGARDLPARQQTLRATIHWSYDLLSADQQRLFRALGVFPGTGRLRQPWRSWEKATHSRRSWDLGH